MTFRVDENDVMWIPKEVVREQIANILSAWGMHSEHVKITSTVMVDADSCGIDTHGISMIPPYEDRRKRNVITLDADISVLKETATTALIDAGGGLGYVPSILATEMCINKAKEYGMSAVTVKESAHFGATGYYTRMMADAGLIGIATTNGSGPRTAPTHGKDGKLSTNPIAFAAPTKKIIPSVWIWQQQRLLPGRFGTNGMKGKNYPSAGLVMPTANHLTTQKFILVVAAHKRLLAAHLKEVATKDMALLPWLKYSLPLSVEPAWILHPITVRISRALWKSVTFLWPLIQHNFWKRAS